MSRNKAPQQQYGFITGDDENPFDEGPMPAPVKAAPARAPAKSVPAGNAGVPRAAQPRPPAAAPAPPPAAASPPGGATAPAASPAASPAGAAAPKKSGFASMFGIGGASTAAAGETDEDAALREANLKAREEKMRQREMEIEARERVVKQKEQGNKNWPFKRCAILYHSIPEQIPSGLQPMIRKFYYLVMWTWICLIWNAVTVVTEWGETGDGGTDPIWAVIYMLLGVPGSWMFWYTPVFEAASLTANRKYLFFFCVFFLHLGFGLLMALGAPSCGAGGLMVMIKEYAKSYPITGTFSLIDTGLWSLNFFISLYLLKVARDAWRSGGGSEDLAKDRAKLKMASKAGLAAV